MLLVVRHNIFTDEVQALILFRGIPFLLLK